jgi:hypothetical protein
MLGAVVHPSPPRRCRTVWNSGRSSSQLLPLRAEPRQPQLVPRDGPGRSARMRTPSQSLRSLISSWSCLGAASPPRTWERRRDESWSNRNQVGACPTSEGLIRVGESYRGRAQGRGPHCGGPYESRDRGAPFRLKADGCDPFGACVPEARLLHQGQARRRSSAAIGRSLELNTASPLKCKRDLPTRGTPQDQPEMIGRRRPREHPRSLANWGA